MGNVPDLFRDRLGLDEIERLPDFIGGWVMTAKNVQVTLAHRPTGWVQESDFRIVESAIPDVGSAAE
jgi:hypothetical protein